MYLPSALPIGPSVSRSLDNLLYKAQAEVSTPSGAVMRYMLICSITIHYHNLLSFTYLCISATIEFDLTFIDE